MAAAAAAAAAAVLADRKLVIPQVTTVGGHQGQAVNLIPHFETFVNGQQQQ